MNVHHNARLTPLGRAVMIERIEGGWPVRLAAGASGVSARTGYRWLARHRREGMPGLRDRSSAPHGCPHRVAAGRVAEIERLRRQRMTGPAIFGLMIWVFYLRFTVPVLGVFYGTSLMADEVEDKTITYLFVRPIRRGAVLVGKYLAYLACTIFVVLPSVMLVYFLVVPLQGTLGGSFIDLLKDLGLLALGLLFCMLTFSWLAVYSVVVARMRRVLTAPRVRRALDALAGSVLVAFGVRLAFEER